MNALISLSGRTPVVVQGASGRMGRRHTQLMGEYGTHIVAGTSMREAGGNIDGIPLFADCAAAVRETGATASICMVPPLETRAAVEEAVAAGISLVVTIAEGVPVHDALHLRRLTQARGVVWVGASTPGVAVPGQAKLGFLPNVALRPGSFALLSKSGTLGYLGSYKVPEVVLGVNSFALSAQKQNPKAKVKLVLIDSWFDPPKEAAATETLINLGCDIVTTHTDSPGPLQILEQKGLHGFGQGADMSQFAPNAHLTAIEDIWGPYYVERV